MKIFVIVNVARQVAGEYVLVRTEKAFTEKKLAEDYLAGLVKEKVEEIVTEVGNVQCYCVRGIYEVDCDIQRSL